MFDTLKNLSSWFLMRPSYDFFGPEASKKNLSCALTLEPAFDHLIQDCNAGVGRARVIDAMAKQIVESKMRPTWLRYNASIDLEKLRKTVKMTDAVAEKLLTKEGFVKLSDLHFFDRESMNLTSQAQFNANRFRHCPMCRRGDTQVTFSAAIALRILMGKSFNPKACPEAFQKSQPLGSLQNRYEIWRVSKPTKTLEAIKSTVLNSFDMWFWSRAIAVTAITVVSVGTLYYAGLIPSFSILGNRDF